MLPIDLVESIKLPTFLNESGSRSNGAWLEARIISFTMWG